MKQSIPTNVYETTQQLLSINNIILKNISEDEFLNNFKNSYSNYILNNWELHINETSFVKWFNNIEVYHINDMIDIILKTFYRKVNSKNINLNKEIKKIKKLNKNGTNINTN